MYPSRNIRAFRVKGAQAWWSPTCASIWKMFKRKLCTSVCVCVGVRWKWTGRFPLLVRIGSIGQPVTLDLKRVVKTHLRADRDVCIVLTQPNTKTQEDPHKATNAHVGSCHFFFIEDVRDAWRSELQGLLLRATLTNKSGRRQSKCQRDVTFSFSFILVGNHILTPPSSLFFYALL